MRSRFKRKFSNAKKCIYKGIKFDSELERDRYIYLKSLEVKGLIQKLTIQHPFTLMENQSLKGHITPSVGKNTARGIKYICDFVYYRTHDNTWVANDTKGRTTDVYKIKLKMFLALYGMNYQFLETYKDSKKNNFKIF